MTAIQFLDMWTNLAEIITSTGSTLKCVRNKYLFFKSCCFRLACYTAKANWYSSSGSWVLTKKVWLLWSCAAERLLWSVHPGNMFYLCHLRNLLLSSPQGGPASVWTKQESLELSVGVVETFSELHDSLKLLLPNPFSFLPSQIPDLHHDLKTFLTYFCALFHRHYSQ